MGYKKLLGIGKCLFSSVHLLLETNFKAKTLISSTDAPLHNITRHKGAADSTASLQGSNGIKASTGC